MLCCMGFPRDYVLRDGDVYLDFAVSIDGWVADSAVTVIVGDRADAADRVLIESTQRALDVVRCQTLQSAAANRDTSERVRRRPSRLAC